MLVQITTNNYTTNVKNTIMIDIKIVLIRLFLYSVVRSMYTYKQIWKVYI